MRHKLAGRKFNRTSAHRKAMFRNMSVSLIDNELIRTTLPKAKDLRGIIEPIITHAKNHDDVAGRRLAFSRLRDRKGGYVRILKCGYRPGDQAPMAYVELVDRPLPNTDAE